MTLSTTPQDCVKLLMYHLNYRDILAAYRTAKASIVGFLWNDQEFWKHRISLCYAVNKCKNIVDWRYLTECLCRASGDLYSTIQCTGAVPSCMCLDEYQDRSLLIDTILYPSGWIVDEDIRIEFKKDDPLILTEYSGMSKPSDWGIVMQHKVIKKAAIIGDWPDLAECIYMSSDIINSACGICRKPANRSSEDSGEYIIFESLHCLRPGMTGRLLDLVKEDGANYDDLGYDNLLDYTIPHPRKNQTILRVSDDRVFMSAIEQMHSLLEVIIVLADKTTIDLSDYIMETILHLGPSVVENAIIKHPNMLRYKKDIIILCLGIASGAVTDFDYYDVDYEEEKEIANDIAVKYNNKHIIDIFAGCDKDGNTNHVSSITLVSIMEQYMCYISDTYGSDIAVALRLVGDCLEYEDC